jgi:hypothetical protein
MKRKRVENKEITKKEALSRIEIEINKYIRLCHTCYFFDKKQKVCDMCDYGGLSVTNNHGLKPSQVQRCDVYEYKTGEDDEN